MRKLEHLISKKPHMSVFICLFVFIDSCNSSVEIWPYAGLLTYFVTNATI